MNRIEHYRCARRRPMRWEWAAAAAAIGGVLLMSALEQPVTHAQEPVRFSGPMSSQPLALPANGQFLAVANPDNDSVSFFDLRADRNRKLVEVPVQNEPNGVAMMPDGRKAYVANTIAGTVTVLNMNLGNGVVQKPTVHIPVGTEPYGLCLTPNGRKLYVSNARSHDISVIDTATDKVIKTISAVGFEPRGLAITNDEDDDDNDETLYVTQFLALPVPGKLDGSDDSKTGRVTVISVALDTVFKEIVINPLPDTGFKANGDALARIAPGPNFTFTTGAYPNLLNNIAIKGGFAFLPNTGSSPNGPVRFDVNTQSLVSVVNLSTNLDAGKTINMHLAVAEQPTPRLFITQPWAMAFERNSNEGWVVSYASNIVVKLEIDPTTGTPEVQADPSAPNRVFQIPVGKNPRGIAINAADTRAYVMNQVSRDVTVLNLTTEQVLTTMQSAALPAPGSDEDKVHVGRELYHTSVGVFDPPTTGAPPIRGRMSNNGWGACSACHPFGLTDNVVWIFPAGPRRTIPQHSDFDPSDPNRVGMRPLNWSSNRDEQEDFELNIRAVSGGQGLIVLADGITQDPNVQDLTPTSSANRNQLKVRGIPAWDALKAYIQFGIRGPISPVPASDPDAIIGRQLFIAANCQQCHGGPLWTTARVRHTPPPAAGLVVAGQVIGELRKVGTFDPTVFNEIRQNAAPPLGADGFVPPSLLSVGAFPQTFFHNGAAASLADAMNNVTHRSAGTGGVDTLTNAGDRARLVRFLESIDLSTPPVP